MRLIKNQNRNTQLILVLVVLICAGSCPYVIARRSHSPLPELKIPSKSSYRFEANNLVVDWDGYYPPYYMIWETWNRNTEKKSQYE